MTLIKIICFWTGQSMGQNTQENQSMECETIGGVFGTG